MIPRLFIEETGKTGTTDLINIAQTPILAKVGVGDKVQLHVIGHTIFARNAAGEDIGQIEPRLANRLINFMEGGNRYAAAILVMEPGMVRLIIREDYQHPTMFGKAASRLKAVAIPSVPIPKIPWYVTTAAMKTKSLPTKTNITMVAMNQTNFPKSTSKDHRTRRVN